MPSPWPEELIRYWERFFYSDLQACHTRQQKFECEEIISQVDMMNESSILIPLSIPAY